VKSCLTAAIDLDDLMGKVRCPTKARLIGCPANRVNRFVFEQEKAIRLLRVRGFFFDDFLLQRICVGERNSPEPFDSIKRLAEQYGEHCLTGAGTVIKVADVARVADAGGRLVVMPHGDVAIVREAKRRGLVCLPGVATPTEAFAALDAGADGLKMFPAEQLSPAVLKAWRAVLPRGTLVFPVGGIRPDNMAPFWAAGADGFGTGSNLYKPGASAEMVRASAAAYASGFRALRREQ
jgi:2-dehydro-3-deoxyphosphogalactonate aldolase